MRRHQHFDNHHIQKPLDQLSNTPHGSSISHINRAGYHHHHPNNSIHHQVWSGVRRFASGFFDSLRVRRIVNELHAKRTLKILIVQNSILQLVSIASLVGLESYSDSHRSSSWSTLDVLFSTFWLFPIGVISIAWNSSITENCLHLNGSLQAPISLGKFSISSSVEIIRYLNAKLRSDYHRILILLNYFLFAEGLLLIPFVGFLLSFAFCSVGNSFYCFDPYWLKDGLNLEERLDLLEKQWDYHLGFGLIMTILTSIWPHHNMLNLSIFTLLFPFLLILSTGKKTYHRLSSEKKEDEQESKSSVHPSYHSSNPIQLPIFCICRKLHLLFFNHLVASHPHNLHLNHSTVYGHVHIEDGGDHL